MPASMSVEALSIPVVPLTADAFAPFGEVVENPLRQRTDLSETTLPSNAVRANQGSAIKMLDITHITNFYGDAPSKKAAKAVMNMFICSPRPLRQDGSSETINGAPISSKTVFQVESRKSLEVNQKLLFDVKILERHPFTPQTFIPMGLGEHDTGTSYLVIVAPTRPSELDSAVAKNNAWRQPAHNYLTRAKASLGGNNTSVNGLTSGPDHQRKGSGPPDVTGICAFLASGRQAVTYAAGTWHAPMVVLGMTPVDFVVVQFANGVAEEDCQEIELHASESQEGISIALEVASDASSTAPASGNSKAKL